MTKGKAGKRARQSCVYVRVQPVAPGASWGLYEVKVIEGLRLCFGVSTIAYHYAVDYISTGYQRLLANVL
jgi:hypothetical protein